MVDGTEVRRLTEAARASQARRAAAIAALVSLYYRQKVAVKDPRSVERWIDLMLPKILSEHDKQATAAARYGNRLRQLELGTTSDYSFQPTAALNREQVERSLRIVGPERHLRKMQEIEESDLEPTMKRAMINDARSEAVTALAGSVARHVQDGARRTTYDNIAADPVCLGYIRITKTDPCYFCAALASRGAVYGEDSFDESDPRFTTGKNGGNVKVHDSCGCALKPVYTDSDEFAVDAANFEALWYQWSSGGDPMYTFRRNYEGRADGPMRRVRR